MARNTVANRVASTRTNSILYNGDFEEQPGTITAATNTSARWIDGTAGGSTASRAFGWAVTPAALAASAESGFDTSTFRSGTGSLRLSCLDTSGVITVGTYRDASVQEYFPIQASTSYTLTGWIKTDNVASNAAFIDLRQFSAAGANLATTSSTKLSGTNDWTEVSFTVTTNASAAFATIFLRNSISGNVSDAWYDDITLVPASIGRVAASSRATP